MGQIVPYKNGRAPAPIPAPVAPLTGSDQILVALIGAGDFLPTHWRPPDHPIEYPELVRIGRAIERVRAGAQFWLGDWLRKVRQDYGEEAMFQAAADADISPAALTSYLWVTDHFPPETRHPDLLFTHHKIAAALPGATKQRVLELAATNGWSTRQLKEHVDQRKGQGDPSPFDGVSVCPMCGQEVGHIDH